MRIITLVTSSFLALTAPFATALAAVEPAPAHPPAPLAIYQTLFRGPGRSLHCCHSHPRPPYDRYCCHSNRGTGGPPKSTRGR